MTNIENQNYMNTLLENFEMTQKRKREQNLLDEVEFMPLSKRINNLHIHNPLLLEHSVSQHFSNKIDGDPGPSNFINQFPESPTGSEGSIQFTPEYKPDLNEAENPHYFNVNKMLFEMYIQRLQRGCHQI